MDKSKKGFTSINLLLLVGSMLFFLIVIELFFVIFHPVYPSIYIPDDNLLYKLAPGGKKIFNRTAINGGQKIFLKVSEKGFRGNEFSSKNYKRRIVVYGDSFIESDFSKLKSTFCQQLENKLKDITRKTIEVINAGITGYGPDQSLLKLMQDYNMLKPDFIIFSIYSGNDFGDLMRKKYLNLIVVLLIMELSFQIPQIL